MAGGRGREGALSVSRSAALFPSPQLSHTLTGALSLFAPVTDAAPPQDESLVQAAAAGAGAGAGAPPRAPPPSVPASLAAPSSSSVYVFSEDPLGSVVAQGHVQQDFLLSVVMGAGYGQGKKAQYAHRTLTRLHVAKMSDQEAVRAKAATPWTVLSSRKEVELARSKVKERKEAELPVEAVQEEARKRSPRCSFLSRAWCACVNE